MTCDLLVYAYSNISFVADDLLVAVGNPPIRLAGQVNGLADSIRELVEYQNATLGHMYFCATLLQIFGDISEEHFESEKEQFDVLALARRQLAVNSRLSWITVSNVRSKWGLAELPQPASFRDSVVEEQ